MDGAYIGGRVKGKDKYGNKSPVLAVIERGGEARASSVPDHKADTQGAFLQKHVDHKESILMTDSTKTLYNAAKGYERHMVDHSRLEYSRGTVHVNTVESFWSHLKRSVKGTHKSVSTQHLQGYLDAFAFHWSNSRSDTQRFSVLLGTVLLSTT